MLGTTRKDALKNEINDKMNNIILISSLRFLKDILDDKKSNFKQ